MSHISSNVVVVDSKTAVKNRVDPTVTVEAELSDDGYFVVLQHSSELEFRNYSVIRSRPGVESSDEVIFSDVHLARHGRISLALSQGEIEGKENYAYRIEVSSPLYGTA
jgi:DNA-binding transcriptional regulator WhiA